MANHPAEVTDSPIDWVARHIRQYVATDGREGGRRYGHDSLLLTTRGRRTGRPRRTALFYWRDGDAYVVVASNGGEPAYPDWYRNLIADAEVAVQVGADLFLAHARPATAEERPRLWGLVVQGFPRYARYQRKASRELPVVVLRPVPPSRPDEDLATNRLEADGEEGPQRPGFAG